MAAGEIELKQPLSLWEKVKTGTVSFVKGALHYIPRGIPIAAAIVGAAMVVTNMGGWDLLGVGGIDSVGGFLARVGLAVGLGSLINGGIGAYQGIKAESAQRQNEIDQQERVLNREKGRSRALEQQGPSLGNGLEVLVQHGLPHAAEKLITGPGLVS